MANKKKYNWPLIEDRYVTGGDEITLQSLHDTYLPEIMDDIPAIGSLKRQSTERGWWEKRKQYRNKVHTETQKRIIEHEADLRVKHFKLGGWLQGVGTKALTDIIKAAIDTNVTLSPYVALQILKEGVSIERKALGMPDIKMESTSGNSDERSIVAILAQTIGISEEQVTEILEDSSAE